MQFCKKCNSIKEESEFYTLNTCKDCRNLQKKMYKQANILKEIERNVSWYKRNSHILKDKYIQNKDIIKNKNKKYYQGHKEEYRIKNTKQYLKSKQKREQDPILKEKYKLKKIYEYVKKTNSLSCEERTRLNLIHNRVELYRHHRMYYTDIKFRLKKQLRSRLGAAIKNNQKTGSAIKDLGCSIEELKLYLESKFLPGMAWYNWSRIGWHIDHIRPLNSFDLTDPEQFKVACHYTNLQPLWAKDNLRKGSKYDKE